MKARISLLLACAAIFMHEAAAECDKLPADLNIENCCKFPTMDDEATIKKIAEQFKDQKLDDFMMECKVTEAMFKELKLNKDNGFDKDAILKHIDTNVKEAIWKPIMKSAAEECLKEVTEKKDEIIKELEKAPFNIKKDQCNALYMSMVTCIHLEGFVDCPKEAWTEEKRCSDAKAWIDKCSDSIDSLKQLASQKSRK